MKFEELIASVGDSHLFQIRLLTLVLMPMAFINTYHESIMLVSTPDHWCYVPQLETMSYELQKRFISPLDPETGEPLSCYQYDVNYSDLLVLDSFMYHVNKSLEANASGTVLPPKIKCRFGYKYDDSLYTETITTKYDLVCDQDYLVNRLFSITGAGVAILTPILSWGSDRYGRRMIFLVSLLIILIAWATPLVFPSFYVYAISRFFLGGIINISFQLPFVMVQEVTNESWRTKTSLLSALFFSLGCCSMPLVAKYSHNWVNMSAFVIFATLPLLVFFERIPESPTWLISRKRYQEAEYMIRQIARINKRPCPEGLSEKIASITKDDPDRKEDGFLMLFTVKGICYKTVALTIGMTACWISYGGILLNTINDEAQDQLIKYLILSVSEIPALFIGYYLVESRLGRRWTGVLGLTICAFFTMIIALVPSSNLLLISVLSGFGKFGVSITFMTTYQHAGELYPTTLRSQGLGFNCSIASTVCILLPQLVYMNKYGEWIPLFVMGSISLVAAIALTTLPETLHQYVPQTAEEAAAFGHKNGFFSLAEPKKTEPEVEAGVVNGEDANAEEATATTAI